MTKKPPPRKKPAAPSPAARSTTGKKPPAPTASKKPPARRSAAKRSNAPWLVGGGVAAVVLVAVVVASMTSSDPAQDSGLVEVAPVTITGAALPAAPEQGAADPAIGLPAPDLSGVSFDETPVAISSTDGRPKALIFLAHW